MFKKSRVTDLKHRITRKKQQARRQLARQLIKGDVTVDQLGRLAGDATNGVLRTVNYLSETEGLTLASNLSQSVAQAIAPASSSGTAILKRMATVAPVAPKSARDPAEAVAVAEAPIAAEGPTAEAPVADAPVAEAPASVEEAAPPVEVAEAAPKKRTRAVAKTAEALAAPPADVAEAAPKKRTRAAAKTAEAPAAEVAEAAPKKRTRAAAKPKE